MAILSKIFAHSADAIALFAMDTFPRLVDLFRTNSDSREQSALIILRVMVAKHPVAAFTDVDLAYQVQRLRKFSFIKIDLQLNIIKIKGHI